MTGLLRGALPLNSVWLTWRLGLPVFVFETTFRRLQSTRPGPTARAYGCSVPVRVPPFSDYHQIAPGCPE
eukprot:3522221-Prymnesium_polylepis.1